jgi:hypothetical protein
MNNMRVDIWSCNGCDRPIIIEEKSKKGEIDPPFLLKKVIF